MIRESLYFIFNGRRSSDFNIYNVSLQNDLYNEPFMANRTIKEIVIPKRDKPHYQHKQRDPLTFTVSFFFYDTWDEDLMDDVVRWLNVDDFVPLQFESDLDRIYYCMPTTGLDIIHNGLQQGYINITFRCNSPFKYSPDIISNWIDSSNTNSSVNFQIENKGHMEIYPEIHIIKVGNGNISIQNLSTGQDAFTFTGLQDGEQLYINCENDFIDSSLGVYRYDNFNDNYLYFNYGINYMQLTGSCKLRFQYQLLFMK